MLMNVWTCEDDHLKWMTSNLRTSDLSEPQTSLPLSLPICPGTLAAMDAAVMWEEELSSVDATPLSFFSSSSSSHCTPLSSVWRRGELLRGGERGGGGEGRSSSSSAASFTFTTASRRRSMACGSAGRMNWKHSCRKAQTSLNQCSKLVKKVDSNSSAHFNNKEILVCMLAVENLCFMHSSAIEVCCTSF